MTKNSYISWFCVRSSFLRKQCICAVCKGESVHLYLPSNNIWNRWTISKSQMCSSHKAPTNFMKGKDKEERERLPHHLGRSEHSPPHPQGGTKPQFHHSRAAWTEHVVLWVWRHPLCFPPTPEHCRWAPRVFLCPWDPDGTCAMRIF